MWKEGRTVDYHALLSSYRTSGFQATNFGLAVEQITKMVGITLHYLCVRVYTVYSWKHEERWYQRRRRSHISVNRATDLSPTAPCFSATPPTSFLPVSETHSDTWSNTTWWESTMTHIMMQYPAMPYCESMPFYKS